VTIDPRRSGRADRPDGLTIDVGDRIVAVTLSGGTPFELPIGPLALLDGPLEHCDVPAPAQLTNALGLVHDHLDDVIIAAPSIVSATSVVASGEHVLELARVEIGARSVPAEYTLHRFDADEVFRTLALEPAAERRYNPGLHPDHVESILGTCCVILGIMRRLDLDSIDVSTVEPPHGFGTDPTRGTET
jgi:exopolyphosphatase/pppGpp-phosphohydrolase